MDLGEACFFSEIWQHCFEEFARVTVLIPEIFFRCASCPAKRDTAAERATTSRGLSEPSSLPRKENAGVLITIAQVFVLELAGKKTAVVGTLAALPCTVMTPTCRSRKRRRAWLEISFAGCFLLANPVQGGAKRCGGGR